MNTFKNINDMKLIKRLLATAALILTITALSAQTPPPPNGGSNPGGGNTPVGGGAPIGSGLAILLLMGAAYGSRKVLESNKEKCNF